MSEKPPIRGKERSGTKPLVSEDETPMARLASSSLPKTQGSGPFALMEQTQKKPGIHSLSLEAEKGS